MRISYNFLNSVVIGMGFTTGSIISLHLYNLIFSEKDEEDIVNNEQEIKTENLHVKQDLENELNLENELDVNYESLFWCRVLRNLSRYSYFTI